MTDPKKTDPETPDPIGPGVSMVDAVSPYLRPKPGWVLAPQARRRPPSFTAPPAQGRSRLLQDGNFVGLPHFADNYEHELLLPPGVAEQFKKLKQRLGKEAADSPETDEHGKHVGQQDDPAQRERAREQERERERQALAAKAAEREEQQAREKLEAELRRMGVNPDQSELRAQIEKLPPTQRLQVYREEDVQRVAASAQSVDSDARKRNEPLGYLLKAKGPWRRIGTPESVEAILALQEDHPHFGEVIQFVANHVALQKMRFGAGNAETDKVPAKGKKVRAGKGASTRGGAHPETADQVKPPVRLPPLLLYGPPGVGKTHFCESLAKVLGVPVRRHPMDQAETSGALLGSDAVWGNSRYGLVFDLLGLGEYANPLVILDELDKAQTMGKTSGGFSSPTGVLHSLLEPVSAAQVRDISLDLELDASQIAWIATANYPWWVPATLRSRFREFFIMPPDAEQAIQLARSVVKNALTAAGFGIGEPDRRIVVALAHLSAREIFQVTVMAAGRAAAKGYTAVRLEHLPAAVLAESDETGRGGNNSGKASIH
ncbi:AAA family ATPase [Hydrogenophaga borbori]|uniref:AAA family ATPase n=1 Tax=Hydrogenophaga borbori TaxID=2294117 RepID=A0A372EE84_9BURK|nr:AAA family ATPase [Hydrogenophaga borbori]RFP76173.1 AAA family ATPase [Hydrogenophaga borbori]